MEQHTHVAGGNAGLGAALDPASSPDDFTAWLNSIQPGDTLNTEIFVDEHLQMIGIWNLLPARYAQRVRQIEQVYLSLVRERYDTFFDEFIYSTTQFGYQTNFPDLHEFTLISNHLQLDDIRWEPHGNFLLTNDITIPETFNGGFWEPIPIFSGRFEGNGFKVSGVNVANTHLTPGFIATNTGVINNLGISYTSRFSGVAGINNGTISRSHSEFEHRTPNQTITVNASTGGGSTLSVNTGTNYRVVVVDFRGRTNADLRGGILTLFRHMSITIPNNVQTIVFRGDGRTFAGLDITVQGNTTVVFDDFRYTGAFILAGTNTNPAIISVGTSADNRIQGAHAVNGASSNLFIGGTSDLTIESTGVQARNGRNGITLGGRLDISMSSGATLTIFGANGGNGTAGGHGTPNFNHTIPARPPHYSNTARAGNNGASGLITGDPGEVGGAGEAGGDATVATDAGNGGNAIQTIILNIRNTSHLVAVAGSGGNGGHGGNGGNGQHGGRGGNGGGASAAGRGGNGGNGGRGGHGTNGGHGGDGGDAIVATTSFNDSQNSFIQLTAGRGGEGGRGGQGGDAGRGGDGGNGGPGLPRGSGGRGGNGNFGGHGGNSGDGGRNGRIMIVAGSIIGISHNYGNISPQPLSGGIGSAGGDGGTGDFIGVNPGGPGTDRRDVPVVSGTRGVLHNVDANDANQYLSRRNYSRGSEYVSHPWLNILRVSRSGRTEYRLGESFDISAATGFTFTRNGAPVPPASLMLSLDRESWRNSIVFDATGTHVVTVNSGVAVAGSPLLHHIPVTVLPHEFSVSVGTGRRSYYRNMLFDPTGFVFTLNDRPMTVGERNRLEFFYDFSSTGASTVTAVFRKGGYLFTAEVVVAVQPDHNNIPNATTFIAPPPPVTTFFIGQPFSYGGAALEIRYASGALRTITEGFIVTPANVTATPGVQTVRVYCPENIFVGSYTVTVVDNAPNNLVVEIGANPHFEGAMFNPAGMSFTLHYSDGSSRIVLPSELNIPATVVTYPTTMVTATFSGMIPVTFNVPVFADPFTHLDIDPVPTGAWAFNEGDNFSIGGRTLRVVRESGRYSVLSLGDVRLSINRPLQRSDIQLTIFYDDHSRVGINTLHLPISLLVGDTPILLDPPTISVSSTETYVGNMANIRISIDDNPGMAVLELAVEYDATRLAIEGIYQIGSILPIPIFIDLNANPLILHFEMGEYSNSYQNGMIVDLQFSVRSEAFGFAPVAVVVGNAFNIDGQSVVFASPINGGVSIEESQIIYGDANNDGSINLADIILLRRYVARHNLAGLSFNRAAADVNGDGVINLADIILLRRYVARHDVTLGSQSAMFSNFGVAGTFMGANDAVRTSVATTSGYAGEYAYVTISLDENPGIIGIQLDLDFDCAVLTPVSVAPGTLIPLSLQPNLDGNQMTLTFESSNFNNIHGTGELATIRFRISTDAEQGEVEILMNGVLAMTGNPNFVEIGILASGGVVEIMHIAETVSDEYEVYDSRKTNTACEYENPDESLDEYEETSWMVVTKEPEFATGGAFISGGAFMPAPAPENTNETTTTE